MARLLGNLSGDKAERGLILELEADTMGSADRKQNQSDKILEGGIDFIFLRRDCEGTDETVTLELAPYGAEGLVEVVPRTTKDELNLFFFPAWLGYRVVKSGGQGQKVPATLGSCSFLTKTRTKTIIPFLDDLTMIKAVQSQSFWGGGGDNWTKSRQPSQLAL